MDEPVTNSVEAEWRSVLAEQLNNNMLMNSPKGKTAFACGIGFVLSEMLHSEEDTFDPRSLRLKELRGELEEFVNAYMAEGEML